MNENELNGPSVPSAHSACFWLCLGTAIMGFLMGMMAGKVVFDRPVKTEAKVETVSPEKITPNYKAMAEIVAKAPVEKRLEIRLGNFSLVHTERPQTVRFPTGTFTGQQ